MESNFLLVALIAYAVSLGLLLRRRESAGTMLLVVAVLIHLGGLITRSIIAGHPPFTNMYETFILLPFLVALRLLLWKEQVGEQFRRILVAVVMLIILIALILPQSLKTPKPLMPALNSIWMYIHVPAYFLAYMALIVALVYAIIVLIHEKSSANNHDISLLRRMDNEIRIAFFFLFIGLVTGGIWAYVSWGNYWAWDPKETWALINILALSFYFHLKIPTARKKALVVILTFLTVVFTYWGVSFILSGLHSYT